MAKDKTAPAQSIFEQVPKISIVTAVTYLIVVYLNGITGDMLSAYTSTATTVMLFGAIFAVPAIIFDIAMTGTFEPGESLWVGFVNFFALLSEYAFSNWDVFRQTALYAIYVYAGLFIFALVVYLVRFYTMKSSAS